MKFLPSFLQIQGPDGKAESEKESGTTGRKAAADVPWSEQVPEEPALSAQHKERAAGAESVSNHHETHENHHCRDTECGGTERSVEQPQRTP